MYRQYLGRIETQLLGIDLIGIFTANKWSKYLVNSLKWAQGTGLIVRNRPANHNNTRNESINTITPTHTFYKPTCILHAS